MGAGWIDSSQVGDERTTKAGGKRADRPGGRMCSVVRVMVRRLEDNDEQIERHGRREEERAR